jgi:phosphoglycolate phosphatase
MKFKGVIFDLDGTLVNSLEDIADAMNSVLKSCNYPIHSYEAYKKFIGSGIKSLVSKALPKNVTNEKLVDTCFNSMIEIYGANCTQKTKPYNGIIVLLNQLILRNIKLGVLSNKTDEFTKKIVASIFPNYFEYVVGLSDKTPKKPNPFGVLEISKNLGIKPEELIFVGDTEIDMLTANNAKMYAVGVSWGFRSKEKLISAGAKTIISNPLDLLQAFY